MRYFKILVAAILTFAILAFLFYKIDIKNIQSTFQASNKALLALASLMLFFSLSIVAFRWKIILGLLGLKISFAQAAKIYLANYPLAKITPINSGDAIRAFYLKDKISPSKQLGGIFTERLFDVAVLSILSLIGAISLKLNPIIWINVAILSGIIIFFIFAPKIKINLGKKWNDRLENFFCFFRILRQQPKSFALMAFLSLVSWLTVLIHTKLAFLAFKTNVPFLSIVAIQPIITFVGLLPFTLSGIGQREPAMIILYSKFSSAPTSLAVGLIYSFVSQILISMLCLPFLFIVWKKIKTKI
jgi:hypothetical protein